MPRYRTPDVPTTPLQIAMAIRRKKVLEMYFHQGMAATDIARSLDLTPRQVRNDIKVLKEQEERQRAARALAQQEDSSSLAVTVDDNEARRDALLDLISSKKTYQQISEETGLSIQTLARDLNHYVQEFGDWGGRTVEQWRDQQLLELDQLFVGTMADSNTEAEQDDDGNWIVTPTQAANIRNKARQTLLGIQERRARLVGADQRRIDINVDKRVVIARIGVPVDELSMPVDEL